MTGKGAEPTIGKIRLEATRTSPCRARGAPDGTQGGRAPRDWALPRHFPKVQTQSAFGIISPALRSLRHDHEFLTFHKKRLRLSPNPIPQRLPCRYFPKLQHIQSTFDPLACGMRSILQEARPSPFRFSPRQQCSLRPFRIPERCSSFQRRIPVNPM